MTVETKAPAPEAGTEGNDVESRVGTLEETVAGIDTRLAAVEESVGNVAKSAERIEQKLNRPGAIEAKAEPAKIEAKAFGGFLRQGRESLPADEVKALRVADDTAGGYLAPDDFVAQVVKGIVEVSPVRQAARVGSTSSGSVILPKRTGRPTAYWVGETEARTETGSTYGQVEIPVHEMACYVDVSLRLLEDAAVNVEAEVSGDLAEEFGRLEGAAFVNGNGTKKPVGVMADGNVAYTPTGNASTLGSAVSITDESLRKAMISQAQETYRALGGTDGEWIRYDEADAAEAAERYARDHAPEAEERRENSRKAYVRRTVTRLDASEADDGLQRFISGAS